jgi:hypothetical protein
LSGYSALAEELEELEETEELTLLEEEDDETGATFSVPCVPRRSKNARCCHVLDQRTRRLICSTEGRADTVSVLWTRTVFPNATVAGTRAMHARLAVVSNKYFFIKKLWEKIYMHSRKLLAFLQQHFLICVAFTHA